MVTGNSLPETSLQESENQSAEKSTRVWQRLHPARLLGVQRGTILEKVGPWVHRGGFAVLETLRTNPDIARIPVIVVSARFTSGNRERSMHAGAKGYITKPPDVAELLAVIRKALSTA